MKYLLFLFLFSIASISTGQKDCLWKPDSVWNTRFPKTVVLGDSANFFYIKGDSVSFHLHGLNTEIYERGKVIYWKDSLVNGMQMIHFYISKRKKAFKGSLTVDIQQIAQNRYSLRVRNSFESFDKTIHLSDIGDFPIIRPKKKVFNPSKK